MAIVHFDNPAKTDLACRQALGIVAAAHTAEIMAIECAATPISGTSPIAMALGECYNQATRFGGAGGGKGGRYR